MNRMNSQKGLLVVFSGPSGSGKGTVLSKFFETNENAFLSVSLTTRPPRTGEEHGKHYYFVDKAEFENLISNNGVLEYAEYCGNYYGPPKEYVFNKLDNGQDVILEIETKGAMKVKNQYKDAVMVFVLPPDFKELKNRLTGRNTEDEQTINKRIEAAYNEIKMIDQYDYIIVNDSIDSAADRLKCIIEAEKCKMHNMKKYIDEVFYHA